MKIRLLELKGNGKPEHEAMNSWASGGLRGQTPNSAPINFMPLASIGPYPIMMSDTPGEVVFMLC